MLNNLLKYISKRGIAILWLTAFLLIALSFIEFSSSSESTTEKVSRLEGNIQKRQEMLVGYVEAVKEIPNSEFIRFENFPKDMIIYRYYSDTLQSWINEFPITDDDIYYIAHTLNRVSGRNVVANSRLASVLYSEEQYVNLGSAWYIVTVNRDPSQRRTIISALLIKDDYPTENRALENRVNPNIYSGENLSIVPIAYDESYVVKSKSGRVLFSVLQPLSDGTNVVSSILKWTAILTIILALFLDLNRERSLKKFTILVIGLVVIAIVAFLQSSELQNKLEIFSPSLYADSYLFNSFGNLLICNLLIFLATLALFMVRKTIARVFFRISSTRFFRYISLLLFIAVPLLFIPYIHLTLRSLILNSSIVMDIYKIDEISIYTLIAYVSYGLLFAAMLFLLQILRPLLGKGERIPLAIEPVILFALLLTVYVSYGLLFAVMILSLLMLRPLLGKEKRISFMTMRPAIVFTILISVYMVFVVRHFGVIKEFDQNSVLATKISIDRDIDTELLLRDVENMIGRDWILAESILAASILKESVLGPNTAIIQNRLAENHMWHVLQRYDMTIAICDEESFLIDNGNIGPNCWRKYGGDIEREGTQLGARSKFYYMNKENGRINYLGVFSYDRGFYSCVLYVELKSKFRRESIGYPDILLNYRNSENYNIPPGYSYAKYKNDRLSSFLGDFNYPTSVDSAMVTGYKMSRSDGYIHFTSKLSPDSVITISRKDMGALSYILSFSYLALFYSLLVVAPINVKRRRLLYMIPRNTFRWKISVLIIASLVIALVCMGAGSIWFTVRYLAEGNTQQMVQKLHSVQSALSAHSKDADRYDDQIFNTASLLGTISSLSSSTEMDINVYGADGFLLRTTRSEVFDRFLVGKRMNSKAYYEIARNQRKQYIQREQIGTISYYSLYAPLYNDVGRLIAIVNIPYFSQQNDFSRDTSSIIAAIINIYLLLLIAAVFLGIALANSVSRPLAEISRKMALLDITKQPEHIDYNSKDELGGLVEAYNKMVDVLNESTLRLAQGEREQAWREMARQIAHEIKNPLTPMRLSIQHLLRLKSQGVEDWPMRFDNLANSLIEQIDILSDAAGEFSSFSRFYTEENMEFDLNEIIREQLTLFNIGDNIHLSLESEMEEARIVARKNQIIRVFVNLLSNAVQAVPTQNGVVVIFVKKREDSYIISIEDNGPGVPEKSVNRLFNPNFTTKSGGTGLGLAICRSIIEQSGGKTSYRRSERLGGAAFIIEIPQE